MIGIIFLAIIGLWIWADVKITLWLLQRVSSRLLHHSLAIIVFVTLLVLPVTDEIIGGYQLRPLCEKVATSKMDGKKIAGKTVRSVIEPSNKELEGTAVKIYYSYVSYRDIDTNEELANYSDYVAEGGWLIRTLSTNNHIPPLTIHPSSCTNAGLIDTNFKRID